MIELVYICSAARSGSTLLNQMIGAHPLALPAGEVARLSKNIALDTKCSCGQPVSTCEFWQPVVRRLGEEAGVDLWRNPYALDLGFIRAVSEVDKSRQTRLYLLKRTLYMGWLELLNTLGVDCTRSRLAPLYRHWLNENLRVHDALRSASGRQIVVDSSKAFRFAAGFCRLRPQGTRIILLSRDGRGVVSSYLRSGQGLQRSVRGWTVYYERALKWIGRGVNPDHVLRVYYEDLVADPAAEMARIFGFLGLRRLDESQDMKDADSHILAGNRNTLRSAAITTDERWRRELSPEQIQYFARSGGAMMNRLGYSMAGLVSGSADRTESGQAAG